MLPIKWRLLIAGCIVSTVSTVLLVSKGLHPYYLMLLGIGTVALILGLVLLLRPRRG